MQKQDHKRGVVSVNGWSGIALRSKLRRMFEKIQIETYKLSLRSSYELTGSRNLTEEERLIVAAMIRTIESEPPKHRQQPSQQVSTCTHAEMVAVAKGIVFENRFGELEERYFRSTLTTLTLLIHY